MCRTVKSEPTTVIDALPAFPAQHIVFSRRRRKSTPATAVVMKICTTKFASGVGMMCSTVNGRVGRTYPIYKCAAQKSISVRLEARY